MDWTLFFSALVSATLFPGGSEALLLYRVHEGADELNLLLVATAGNVLGSIITYGMGWFGSAALHKKWLRMDEEKVARAEVWFGQYGQLSLLFAWLPVVGDPLCLVAGLLKSPFVWFVLLVTLGKCGRYALLLGVLG